MRALPTLRFLFLLLILTAIYSIGLFVLASHGLHVRPQATEILWKLGFPAFLASWVHLDKQNKRLNLPFEFDAFVFFGWPVALPYYLYRTRGKRGLLITTAVYALYVAPMVILAIAVTIARLH